mgnify:FL=1
MSRSNFTDTGLPIGQNDVNMTYLYGLSDFFTVMFQDTATVNLLLEAEAQGASEIYSQFLQLCSTLSLEKIGLTVGSSIKLVLVNSTSAVRDRPNTYSLSETILEAKFIANRPFLPTTTLESDVDFGLETTRDGRTTITFARPIEEYAFSQRSLPGGVRQYALWFVDAEIDERLLSTYYGQLIGVQPENSTEAFHSFVYGLFYVYTQGPTLDVMRKGLNLTLGIPLARSTETVIDIRNYLDTNQFIVITDQNQYVIPYGLPPSVSIGDTIRVGDELAKWVEIKDYQSDGEWWINLQIPPSIIPTLPEGQKDRYASPGSHFDYLMRNYLKKHTFLVNVNVSNFQNIQTYQELSDIIRRAKPTYTQPIYIWTIDRLTETLTLIETAFTTRVDPIRCENIGLPIAQFYRGNDVDPAYRSCPQFIRFNVPYYVAKLCGTDPYVNGDPESLSSNGMKVTGFTNWVAQYRGNTEQEEAWMRAILARGSETWRAKRSQIGFHKKQVDPDVIDGLTVNMASRRWGAPAGFRLIPLYITTEQDIIDKSLAVNKPPPSPQLWSFPLFGANTGTKAINAIGINEERSSTAVDILREHFDTLFFRGPDVFYLGAEIPEKGWETYAPTVDDIRDRDYLLGIRITHRAIGVYWVTSNFEVDAPSYFPVSESDPLLITYDRPLTRDGGLNGTSFYALRSRGRLDYNNVDTAINEGGINAANSVATPRLLQVYRDKYNEPDIVINRSGVKRVHAIESH